MTRVPDSASSARRPRLAVEWDDPARAVVADRSPLLARVSIAARLYGLTAIFVLSSLVAGLVLLGARSAINRGLDEMLDAANVATDQMEADMMHDALHADVLAALVATTPERIEQARNDVREHGGRFDDLIGQMLQDDHNPASRAQIEAVRPKVQAYASSAERLVDLASRDRALALEQLPVFEGLFEDLERQMAAVDAEVEGDADAARVANTADVDRFTLLTELVLVVVAALGSVASFAIARSIVQPLASAVSSIDALARRDCTYRAEVVGSDEVAAMSSSLNRSLASTADVIATIRQSATEVAANATQVTAVGKKVGEQVEVAASRISAASAAADLVSGNVQTLASGVEEMGAAIREVAHSAAQAARVATNAVEMAGRTNDTMMRLGDSSSEIGKVVKVITSIAQQTNLLALNATIEAARAGEAGKGFAIVANEVKDLAKETARATEDIHRRVEAIQTDTRVAVQAIEEIGEIIKQINELQVTIAGAVEEQTATASEIARNISDAARGSAEIASSVGSVVAVTRQTEEGATELLRAATGLGQLATELQAVTNTFRT